MLPFVEVLSRAWHVHFPVLTNQLAAQQMQHHCPWHAIVAHCCCCCLVQTSLGLDPAHNLRRSGSAAVRTADQHHARGYAFRKQGNFAAAIQEYSKAIQLDSHHFKALFNRGFSLDKVTSVTWGAVTGCLQLIMKKSEHAALVGVQVLTSILLHPPPVLTGSH